MMPRKRFLPGSQPTGWSGLGQALRYRWQRSQGTLSLWIIYVCTGLFVLVTLLDVTGLVSRQETIAFLGLSSAGVFKRLWLHQFLTAPLLHASPGHLLFNMLSVWLFGPEVERALGKSLYVVFSALTAASAMAVWLLLDWGGHGGVCLGYSAVIFGLFVAQAMFFPNSRLMFFFFFPLKMKHAVLIMGAMELYFLLQQDGSGVAHSAHLAGAAAALLVLKTRSTWEALLARARQAGLAARQARRRKAAQQKARQGTPWDL